MKELKTLKDAFEIKCKTPEHLLVMGEQIRRAESFEKQERIRWIAKSWFEFIQGGMKSEDDLMWEKLTGNTLTYDKKTRECICVFIKHFFNLTEKELEGVKE